MKAILNKIVGLQPLLAVFLLAVLFSGCAPKIRIKVLNPAEVDTTGIKKVAVGNFEIVEVNRVFKMERNGEWQTKEIAMTDEQKKALSNQIRARVVNLLSTTPYFQLVYTDEFQALESDTALQKAIAAGGYKTSEIDAVINGKIWLDVVNMDGAEVDKTELEYVQGGGEGSFNYNVEILAFWPYKSIRGTLALEMKLTRLNPTEVMSVTFDTRKCSYKLGGKLANLQEQLLSGVDEASASLAEMGSSKKEEDKMEESALVLPNFDQIVANMAESIAAQFVRRVSVTQKEVSYPIATGGDKTAKLLIEAGAYEKAIEKLNQVLDASQEKNPDDLYNLGLCYEATGDFGIAAVTYDDAIKADPENFMYAQGMGRIEKLKRENRRLREQLSSKK
ncbi:MAG: tetratricopeptide repeat protein [Proteobacteria bacterium]|nr:tetratricopeptide repeat protein [Pseudomonadota bacterium]